MPMARRIRPGWDRAFFMETGLVRTLRRALTALLLNILSWLIFLGVMVVLYFGLIRDFQMTWGATDEDVGRKMMGDELLLDPELNATRAVEIGARPQEIWPWIVQMGYKRAGFYGFDNLDNGGMRSAETILTDYQELQVGDSIPGGEYNGKIGYLLVVEDMDPGKEMLWVFLKGTPWEGATWSWFLYNIEDDRSRLVSRLRHKYTINSYQELVSWSLIDAIEILMMRTTLRGIKHRAEGG
jgi:hypothetical protein